MKLHNANESKRLESIIDYMIMDSRLAFYIALFLRLNVKEDITVNTFETDGKFIYYNPEFSKEHDTQEIIFIFAHEVLHCALYHIFRLAGKNRVIANMAADYIVNAILVRDKIGKPPKSVLLSEKYNYSMSFEDIYAALLREAMEQQNQQGQTGQQGQT